MFIQTHFRPNDLYILLFSIVLLVLSFFLFRKNKYTASIVTLTLGAFAVRFFVADLEHFLTIWDESYHAAVARNMMVHPFMPMLYANPVLPYNDQQWIDSHIWLHKQPLFLWLMAISLKIFGINEMGVRMPSVIMSALITPMIYRIGKITIHERAGYYSAFLFALSGYMLEVAAGYIPSDHNDAAFIFFVTASFWAWFEYDNSANKKWLYVIGILAGMAVLVKWLMGLLIYFCWSLTIFFNRERRKSVKSYKEILTSAFIAAIVFIPWQIYILIRFTDQALFSYSTFSKHLTEVVEKHGGPLSFYFELISKQFGNVTLILGPALLLLYLKLKGKNIHRIVLFGWVITTYIVYTIAATKMPLFVLISSPVIFLSLGTLFATVTDFVIVKLKGTTSALMLWTLFIVIGFYNLDIDRLESAHTERCWDSKWLFEKNTYIADMFKNIAKLFPKKDYVLFYPCEYLQPTAMFYTGMTTYGYFPDKDQITDLKKQGVKMAFLTEKEFPDYILNDPSLVKLYTGEMPHR